MRFLYLAAFIFLSIGSHAQLTEKIEADRPDQTETPFVTPKRYFQAEFGLATAKYVNDYQQFIHPTSLLKYGVGNRLELRVESTFLTEYPHDTPLPKTTTILEPVEVGTKVRLFEEKGLLPKTSVLLQIGLPFAASAQFRSVPVPFSARLAMQSSLTENISLGYNVGIEGGSGEFSSFIYTFSPGFNFCGRWYTYIEVFGLIYNDYTEYNLDAGVAYSLSNNTKVDLSTGFGLGNAPLKNYIALGFSFRLSTVKY